MRLIDADALEELFREVIGSLSRRTDCNLNFEYMIRTSAMTIEMIKDAPTIKQPRWIPCSERLPEEPYGCIVTVWDTDFITMDEFENLLPYFVGWDGEQWNDADGEQCPFEVIAWMPLPKPYGGDVK